MKYLKFLLSLVLGVFMTQPAIAKETGKTAYDFEFKTIQGKPLPLSEYKGKVLLVVNTASKCGFTGQYKELEALWNEYKEKGLVVIGVPANDFGGQEPGTEEEIAQFCEINYGVSFPMTKKYAVTGKERHPFYAWIDEALGNTPKWNFHKYLIGRDGKAVDYFNSTTSPTASSIKKAINEQLAKNQ